MSDFPELQRSFDAAKAAHLAEPYPDHALRKDRLDRLEAAIIENEEALLQAMNDDFGTRSAMTSELFDLTTSIGDIRANRSNMRKWMAPRSYMVPKHLQIAKGRVIPQPKGVVGVIAPWNYPVYLAISPMSGALAAGNRVMLKPSELSPRTSDVLQQMIADHFAPDEVSVHTGGADLAQAFSALPFDHLIFTGSTAVGRKVAQAAADNLTPVTLELGGKSPAILGHRADLERAAERIAFGKTANAGQICVSPDYALVPRKDLQEFRDLLVQKMKEFYPGGIASEDYCSIINDKHYDRLTGLLDEAERAGAHITRIGQADEPEARKLRPALVLDPPLDGALMCDEIFGPILPILPYDTIAEAMEFVAQRPSPLALYIFTEDKAERDSWLYRSLSGGACVNETILHVGVENMPFGGVGESGIGAYHGKVGFDAVSHLKSVFYQSRQSGAKMLNPPYGARKEKLAQLLRRFI